MIQNIVVNQTEIYSIENNFTSPMHETFPNDSIPEMLNEISYMLPSHKNKIIPLSNSTQKYKAFVVPDGQQLALVLLCPMQFEDGRSVISVCSICNNDYSEFLVYHKGSNSLSIPNTGRIIKCGHIRIAVSFLFSSLGKTTQNVTEKNINDLVADEYQKDGSNEYFINEEGYYVAAISLEYGCSLFQCMTGKWRCVACKNRNAYKCTHGKQIDLPVIINKKHLSEDQVSFMDIDKRLLTKEKIDLSLLQPIFAERTKNQFSFVMKQFKHDSLSKNIQINPEASVCENCKHPLSVKVKNYNGVIFLPTLMKCDVQVKECKNITCCKFNNLISFSGHLMGYINYNNKIIIGVELIMEYLNLFQASGLAFESWWTNRFSIDVSSLNDQMVDSINNWTDYKTKIHSTFAITIEQMIFPRNWTTCCSNPSKISMDGIVASVPQHKLNKYSNPWCFGTIKKKLTTRSQRQLKEISRNDMSLIEVAVQKKHIVKQCIEFWRTSDHAGLRLLSFCFLKTKDSNYELDQDTKPFAKFLLKKTASVRSLLPNSCVKFIER